MIEFLSEGNISIDKVYVHPIWESISVHPHNDGLSLLYIYDIEGDRELVINLNNIDNHTTTLEKFNFDFNECYVYDNKALLNHLSLDNSVDASWIKYLQSNSQLKSTPTPTHTFYERRFSSFKGVNNLIPISKHIETIRDIRNEFLSYYDLGWDSDCVKKFENFYIKSLHLVEQNGIKTTNGMEWTQYHPFTTTSRPSNNFGGVNYAALNKDDGSRDRFISRFEGGKLVQFDYDAYHPRIIGKMVDEPIPMDVSGHQTLADMYGVPYNESKAITFRQLYGGVQSEYLHIPLFSKVSHKIDKMWMEFNRRGYVTTPLGRKLSKSNLKDMNANKLFNYMLQATETELNMRILSKVMDFLKDKKSKMVLYTYDSYLLDIHSDDFNSLQNLKILIEGNGFPTKIEIGNRYSEMESIDINKMDTV
tara:strand:+ start:538 stop:1797 length:1260 start_codon:yes stop_codon:yes gene_type:complete